MYIEYDMKIISTHPLHLLQRWFDGRKTSECQLNSKKRARKGGREGGEGGWVLTALFLSLHAKNKLTTSDCLVCLDLTLTPLCLAVAAVP